LAAPPSFAQEIADRLGVAAVHGPER